MKRTSLHLLLLILIVALVGCSGPWHPVPVLAPLDQPRRQATPAAGIDAPSPAARTSPTATQAPSRATATAVSGVPPTGPADPFDLLSLESLLAYLEDLTAIQAYSGWRNSGSEGEAEALDYVAGKLAELRYLQSLGIELERQSFHVFLATELWETRLLLTVDGQEVEVPADGLRGHRDEVGLALRFDSDGVFNDSEPNPVTIEGAVVLVRSVEELEALRPKDAQGKVVFLDYTVVDRSLMESQQAVTNAWALVEKEPAGVVLVTHFSNQKFESHGAFVGDVSAFTWVEAEPAPPVLYVRLEDLAPAGIEGWGDLERIESARLTWDADVFSPGTSGNLVARIPGADPSQAVILGAHIDSPNAPGAMDDGSGSVILLEVARVLDAAQFQPPTDLYLTWFGSEELSLYGAFHFVASHQALLDRTRAMLQIDCLSRPLDGVDGELRLVTWPYGRLGDARMLWPDAVAQAAAEQGVEPVPYAAYYSYSDNSPFGGFDVPNADLIYEPVVAPDASIHAAGHLHDPYDTVELAREMGDVFEQMAQVVLAAALDAAREDTSLRVTPRPERRALFVGSHTEALHMTPAGFTELSMALAMEGLDVDLIPYGQAVTAVDLEEADLVVVLPVLDYPTAEGDPNLYDEAWTEAEIDVLESYVAGGGLLVLTNSLHRLKYGTAGLDPNEDWSDANALASRLGVTYQEGVLPGSQAQKAGDHPLMQGVGLLEFGDGNGVPFDVEEGIESQVLAQDGSYPAAVLVDHGDAGGQVLVLADVGILTANWGEPPNLPFWQNLARYARSR